MDNVYNLYFQYNLIGGDITFQSIFINFDNKSNLYYI